MSGLTLMGKRLYNPKTGLFLSRDPIPGGSANAYTYAVDPVNNNDLDGTRPLCGGCGGDRDSPTASKYNYNGTKIKKGAIPNANSSQKGAPAYKSKETKKNSKETKKPRALPDKSPRLETLKGGWPTVPDNYEAPRGSGQCRISALFGGAGALSFGLGIVAVVGSGGTATPLVAAGLGTGAVSTGGGIGMAIKECFRS